MPVTLDSDHADHCEPVAMDPVFSATGADTAQCHSRTGVWLAPPDEAYKQAVDDLGGDEFEVPYCRRHQRAFEIANANRDDKLPDTLTTVDEARRLGAIDVIEQLENPYNRYAEDLANLFKWNRITDQHETFAERFGYSPDDEDSDAYRRYEELRSAFIEGMDYAARLADEAAYAAHPRGDEAVQAVLAELRERDKRYDSPEVA
jgi:hypothetical protein